MGRLPEFRIYSDMKVLVVPSDPTLATSWYRATGPFSRLPIEIVKADKFSWETLAGIDVLFIQRPATPTEINIIAEAKKYNVPILLDYDDDPTSLDPSNPVYDIWKHDDKQACVKEALKLADIVMVSTPHLKGVLQDLVPTADIRVVPNAQDDKLFSFEPYHGERNKIMVLRGGSSHSKDWGQWKEGILEILNRYPDWKLAVMGYHPEWLKEISDSQLQLHQFSNIPSYFTDLMKLRPMIGLAPLVDNKFNRSKSNIAAQEFTMAGAAVIASPLPEFKIPGVTLTDDPYYWFSTVVAQAQILYERALEYIPRLSDVNEIRMDILEELTNRRSLYSPNHSIKPPATDQEFHDHCLAYGHTQDYPAFSKAQGNLVEWLIKTVEPRTALELGAGSGGTLIEFLNRGVMAYGVEINPVAVEYFKDHHPMYANQMFLADITKEDIGADTKGDLVYSIEVFEHIDMPEEWWGEFLRDLSTKFKHFYFSSTPYYTNEETDKWWGHRNIRKTSSWIKLFEDNGWKLVSNPKALTEWDLLFLAQ